MARCSECGYSFRTLEDETDMHACPSCGYDGHDEPEDKEDTAEGDEDA